VATLRNREYQQVRAVAQAASAHAKWFKIRRAIHLPNRNAIHHTSVQRFPRTVLDPKPDDDAIHRWIRDQEPRPATDTSETLPSYRRSRGTKLTVIMQRMWADGTGFVMNH
jgi:hypothetical protein